MSGRVERCPQCGLDVTSMEEGLAYCRRCRFPVALVMEKYALERKLAEGGFGLVYRARDLSDEKKYAVKLFRSTIFDVEGMDTFFSREMETVAKLSERNNHILQTLPDYGYHPELGYFSVMEFLEGISLEKWLFRQGRTSLSQVMELFRQLCLAMRAAHHAGIVHRDLKPSNVFLAHNLGQENVVKVLDFGTMKLLSSTEQANLTQGLLGTPAYMAPEQCIREGVDSRTDIYAMGTLLFEMLTGTPPFQAEPSEFLSLIEAHVTKEAPTIQERKPTYEFSDSLTHIVAKALAKNPSERYASVELFWNALVEALPELELEPLPSIDDKAELLSDDCAEEGEERDQLLTNKLAEASESFSLGIAHDYGWGKVVIANGKPPIATDGATGGLPSGALFGSPLHQDDKSDVESKEPPIMMPSLIERVEQQQAERAKSVSTPGPKPLTGRKRGMAMLVGSLVILALMWLLTELSTPPVSNPAKKSTPNKASSR